MNKGIPVAQLMREFNLTHNQFSTLLQKMEEKGILSQAVRRRLQHQADSVSGQAPNASARPQAAYGNQVICQQIEQALDRLLSAGSRM
jgi:hypothetical protein